MTRAEQVTAARAEHGEGPFWDAAGEQLLFVDLERGLCWAGYPFAGTTRTGPVTGDL